MVSESRVGGLDSGRRTTGVWKYGRGRPSDGRDRPVRLTRSTVPTVRTGLEEVDHCRGGGSRWGDLRHTKETWTHMGRERVTGGVNRP